MYAQFRFRRRDVCTFLVSAETEKNGFGRPLLSRTCSIHKRGLHEAEKVHKQNQLSVYLHYSKETEMQYLRLYYCTLMNPD